MTDRGDGERRTQHRRATDHPHSDTRRAVTAVVAVLFVIVAAVSGSVVADRINNGPSSRTAVEQSRDNGQALCDISQALSQVVVVFADSPRLTEEQAAALEQLRAVSVSCPTTTAGGGR